MELKIKSKYAGKKVVFAGGGNQPLGNRSQDDLRKLAIAGLQGKDSTILELFEGQLPVLQELQKAETAKQIATK